MMGRTDGRTNVNEEQLPRADAARSDVKMGASQSLRYALADVSPNIKPLASTPAFMKRNIVGSPLKRSFSAAVEDGSGFKYLKRRRLADDEVLSQMGSGVVNPQQEMLQNLSLEKPSAGIPFVESPSSPTEPNTPSEDDDNVEQGSSQERRSFSSLINYDPSSQTSNSASSALTSAEMLRLRLGIAMYKVRTNQIESSFQDLKDETQCRELAQRKAIDDAVAELRAEAEEVLARAPGKLSSDPPTLPSMARGSDILLHPLGPKSFPITTSPPKLHRTTGADTPLRVGRSMSTPPNTGHRLSHILEPELTSSVVRGRVAEGLLGLRNAF